MGNIYKNLFRFGLILFIVLSLLFSLLINYIYVSVSDNKIDSVIVNKVDTVFIEKPIMVKDEVEVIKPTPTVSKPIVIKEPVIEVEPVTPKIEPLTQPPKIDTTSK